MKRTKMRKPDVSPRLLLNVSDLHCGGTTALCPPEVPLDTGGTYRPSRAQAWLWEQWCEFTEWALSYIDGRPFVLLVNGDLIEGVHHVTTEIVSPEIAVHTWIATKCLERLAAAATDRIFVRGTPVHTGYSTESAIGSMLGSRPDPEFGMDGANRHAWPRARFQVHGGSCRASHHISTTKRPWLEASALGIEFEAEHTAAAKGGRKPPVLMTRAHRHRFGCLIKGNGVFAVTPAWQFPTGFVHKVIPADAEQTEVGGILFDWTTRNPGEPPAVVPWTRVSPPLKEIVYG